MAGILDFIRQGFNRLERTPLSEFFLPTSSVFRQQTQPGFQRISQAFRTDPQQFSLPTQIMSRRVQTNFAPLNTIARSAARGFSTGYSLIMPPPNQSPREAMANAAMFEMGGGLNNVRQNIMQREAGSVISFISKEGQKLYTKLRPNELEFLRNEVKNIPRATEAGLHSNFQLHLDAIDSALRRKGTEISRADFVRQHPQARDVFVKANDPSNFIKDLQNERDTFINKIEPSHEKAVPVDVTQQDQQVAETSTIFGNQGRGGLKGFSNDLKNAFQTWVNKRRSATLEGYIQKQKFKGVPQGLDTLFQIQSGKGPQQIRQYFDNKYKQLTDAGIKMGFKHNYLPQLWTNPEEEVAQKLGDRILNDKPSFTLQSVIKDYQEGIKLGLTPRFTSVGELAGWYEQRANKALADREFFQFLGKNSFIQPSSHAPIGWKTLDPDLFPKISVKFQGGTGGIEYRGVYKAPPELANVINGYLKSPPSELNSVANFSSRLKNIILENGIPGTGINFHGINILARSMLAGRDIAGIPGSGIVKGGLRTAYYLINPGAAQKLIDSNLEVADYAAQHGLSLDVEDQVFGKKAGFLGKLFQVPLFQKSIPAIKIQDWKVISQDLAKHMDPDQAANEASKIVNNLYGGINWEAFGRSRTTQAFLRSIVFAPDFTEGTVRTGANVAASILNPSSPVGSTYRQVARNLLYLYTTANIVNHHFTGHFMWQNAPGHSFEIQVGYTPEGKQRYFRPFGTAADFVRLPYDIAVSLAKGDTTTLRRTIANRLAVPLATVTRFASNVDQYGNPIRGTGDGIYNTAVNFLSTALPQYGEAAVGLLTGKQTGEQAAQQALGLPLRYSGGATNKTERILANYYQKQGKSGEQVGHIIQYIKNRNDLQKSYTAYTKDVSKKKDFYKRFRDLSATDPVIKQAYSSTQQWIAANRPSSDDAVITYAKKALDYFNKQWDQQFLYPVQAIEDLNTAQDPQLSPKERSAALKRARKGR